MGTASQQKTTTQITGPIVEFPVHFRNGNKGRRRLRKGTKPTPKPVEQGRTPRISRLMALAIVFDELIRDGKARNYAELAKLGQVSRARIAQIVNLLNLAPDIQEALLLAPAMSGTNAQTANRRLLRIADHLHERLPDRRGARCDFVGELLERDRGDVVPVLVSVRADHSRLPRHVETLWTPENDSATFALDWLLSSALLFP